MFEIWILGPFSISFSLISSFIHSFASYWECDAILKRHLHRQLPADILWGGVRNRLLRPFCLLLSYSINHPSTIHPPLPLFPPNLSWLDKDVILAHKVPYQIWISTTKKPHGRNGNYHLDLCVVHWTLVCLIMIEYPPWATSFCLSPPNTTNNTREPPSLWTWQGRNRSREQVLSLSILPFHLSVLHLSSLVNVNLRPIACLTDGFPWF